MVYIFRFFYLKSLPGSRRLCWRGCTGVRGRQPCPSPCLRRRGRPRRSGSCSRCRPNRAGPCAGPDTSGWWRHCPPACCCSWRCRRGAPAGRGSMGRACWFVEATEHPTRHEAQFCTTLKICLFFYIESIIFKTEIKNYVREKLFSPQKCVSWEGLLGPAKW